MADITVDDLLRDLKIFKEALPETIKKAILDNQKQILYLQRLQIYDGKNNKGEDIHPLYTEDPYFKTSGQAQGYIKWKQKITPNPRRNPNAPNLYINGYIHRNLIIIEVNGDLVFAINSNVNFGDEILRKYDDLLGLYPANSSFISSNLF